MPIRRGAVYFAEIMLKFSHLGEWEFKKKGNGRWFDF
jgi:hypothetical protein